MVLAAALLLTGCESPSILRSEGSSGNEIVTLATWVFAILAGVLLTVWLLLTVVIVRFRKRPESEASRTKGNLRIEIVWTLIPAVIVTVLLVLTIQTTRQIAMPDPGTQFTAIGRQWWWDFQFKEQGFNAPNEVYCRSRPHHLDRCGVGRRDPLLLGAADGRQGRHDPRPRESHPLHPAHGRPVPRRVLGVLRRAARSHALPLRRRVAGASTRRGSAPGRCRRAQPTGADAVAGKTVVSTVGCGSCHTIRGTSLDGHPRTRPHALRQPQRHRRLHAAEHAREPPALDPGPAGGQARCKMPQRPASAAAATELVAYLEELK